MWGICDDNKIYGLDFFLEVEKSSESKNLYLDLFYPQIFNRFSVWPDWAILKVHSNKYSVESGSKIRSIFGPFWKNVLYLIKNSRCYVFGQGLGKFGQLFILTSGHTVNFVPLPISRWARVFLLGSNLHSNLREEWQCDQMARMFVQYFTIYNNENLHNGV